jgi:2',3'-cyclic-nucleotide 2'-phosphodiesterase (5'-nucleotidase family)
MSVVVASALMTTAPAVRAAQDDEPQNGDIVIVYTNDVHCGVKQTSSGGIVSNIGYAGVAAYAAEMEEAVGEENVTLVDAGDAVQGDAIGTLSHGEYLVEIMNEMGYDVFVPGNHEFDYGMDRMQELMGELYAEVVSSNFTDLKENKTVYEPYTVVEYGETKIAYVGITTPESFTKSTPAYFQDNQGEYVYGFCEGNNGADLYDAVQEAVNDAKGEGADYVIAVGHLGIDAQSAPWRSTDVIANTTGIDAFIDGHSHSVVESDTVENKHGDDVLLTQTGTKLTNIGRMTISDGKITAKLISGYDKQDEDVLAFVNGIYAEFEEDLAEEVGETEVALTTTDPKTSARIVRSRETNLGDLAADAYRFVLGNGKTGAEAAPADIAFVNGGGIRANINAGEITFGEVIAVHPYNNVGCVVEATGQEILDALEMASRSAPGENGGFLQVSGLTYAIDATVPHTVETDDKGMFLSVKGARRVKNVKVGGVPIDAAKTYTLASHNYMLLDGGDGINMFRDNKIVVQPVLLDNQILIDYIQDFLEGTVGDEYADPYGQGRIRVSLPESPAKGYENKDASLALTQLARYGSGRHEADGGVCEIVAYSSKSRHAYAVNGQDGVLTAIDLGALSGEVEHVAFLEGKDIDVAALVNVDGFTYGDLTSVAVSPNGQKLAAAIQSEAYDAAGRVAVFALSADGGIAFEAAYETGVQPDMVVFAGDGIVLTADEGEPRAGYGEGASDPKGSVTIVDLASKSSKRAYFDAFDAQREALAASGVVLKQGSAPSTDFEPEYIAVASGGKAYVTLQEANAVATLDIAKGAFTGVHPLGFQDYSEVAVDFDNNPKAAGGAYSPAKYEKAFGVRMPDGIAAYQAGGKTYVVTANEGDAREWEDYKNEAEYKIETVDGVEMTKKGRFLTDDYDGLPGISDGVRYAFGARSFSVFEAAEDGLSLVYDSGNDFERLTANYLPNYFNCSNDDVEKDSRSNKKGPEPESVTLGAVGGKTYAFVTLERIGGVMVYDVSDPRSVSYVNYINSRDYENVDKDGIGLDDSAEGLCFVPASENPSGKALLIAAFEVSGDVSVYALTPKATLNPASPSSGGPSSGSFPVKTDANAKPDAQASSPAGSSGSASAQAYADVSPSDWFYEAVRASSERGLMTGTGAGFEPHASMTRAMMLTVLARAAGVDTSGGAKWYSKAVDWATANGVSDGANLDGGITREQLVTMLWRYAGEPKASAGGSLSDSGAVSEWARDAVNWAIEAGIVVGYADNSFRPQNGATRAEVATMLARWTAQPAQ